MTAAPAPDAGPTSPGPAGPTGPTGPAVRRWRGPRRELLPVVVGAVALVVPVVLRDADAAGAVVVALAVLALAGRHVAPVVTPVSALVLATTATGLLPGRQPAVVVLVLLAVGAAALHRADGRRGLAGLGLVAVLGAAVLAAVAVVGAGVPGDGPGRGEGPVPVWAVLLMLGPMEAAALLAGSVLRGRRDHLAGLEERARRLEVERDTDVRLAVAAERARVVREVHDVVAHSVTLMVRLTEGLAARAAADPARPADPAALRAVADTGREALGEMRGLLGVLARDDDAAEGTADGALVPQPGLADVDALVEQVRAAGLAVAVTREGELGAVGAGTGLAVHRVVREALTNTLRHAGPGARASVLLRGTAPGASGPGRLVVEVVDDGGLRAPGRAPAADGRGRGLVGMAERAASRGGVLSAGPRADGGWAVHLDLPLDVPAGGGPR